ncbi:MAG: Trk system potassium transporter TrkA [Rhodobacteraceae bacterium]|nr:MAG: Trk system potassium transporter TrkA [Paracoccaceae bacterium]
MKVIICGAGQVGVQIARHLSYEKNDITVVDNNPELISHLSNTLDISGVTGCASHPDILDAAGARDSDMIIATTRSDEVNMVICQVSHSVFSIPRKVARIRSQSYLEINYSDLYRGEHLPIDVIISPEREVAEAAVSRLETPSAFEIETFLGGKAQLIGISLDANCPVINTPLRQLSELFSDLNAIVLGIRRNRKLFVPKSEDQLFAGDQVYVFTTVTDRQRTLEIFGKDMKRGNRIVIVGGGNVGLNVAKTLEQKNRDKVHCKLIEKDRKRAEIVADSLERTVILNGDGLDLSLLEEANIEQADAMLAVTDDDKTNLLTCTRAKSSGCPLAISLVNDSSLNSLLQPMGIDAYINPRATTVSSILRHIRHGRVRAVYSVGDAEAEMIEAQVLGTSPLAGKILKDINWPEGVLVGAVMKENGIIIPRSDTVFLEGDIITVFYRTKDIEKVEKLLEVGINFF